MTNNTIPVPAVPLGAHFDPDATIKDNALAAWEVQKDRNRSQRERNARVAARRVFRTDDLAFEYESVFGLDTPTFVIEDERIVFWVGEKASTFALAELCGECGQDWKGREFASLAALGRCIEQRDDADPFICRECLYKQQLAQIGKRS